MSVDYAIFMQQRKSDGSIVCICPHFTIGDRKELMEIYSSGSSYYFGETADLLRDIGETCSKGEIAQEIIDHLAGTPNDPELVDELYEVSVRVRLSNTTELIHKQKKNKEFGYVPKEQIQLYNEEGEVPEDVLDLESYRELPAKEQNAYEWFEWTPNTLTYLTQITDIAYWVKMQYEQACNYDVDRDAVTELVLFTFY